MVNAETLIRVTKVYDGSDGDATKALYEELDRLGPIGIVAVNVFRANKNSARAKVYKGGIRGKGSYRGMAYDRKQWALQNLCKTLGEHAEDCGITWGWGEDKDTVKFSHVLYVDLPTGHVSFHNEYRGDGPDYGKDWDGIRGKSPERICRWCAQLLQGELETAQ